MLKTKLDLTVDDTQRRQIRLALGRGRAKATRKDIRYWAERTLREALAALPDIPRPVVKAAPPPVDTIDDDAICATCGRPRGVHVGRLAYCPLSKRVKPGSRFHQGVSIDTATA